MSVTLLSFTSDEEFFTFLMKHSGPYHVGSCGGKVGISVSCYDDDNEDLSYYWLGPSIFPDSKKNPPDPWECVCTTVSMGRTLSSLLGFFRDLSDCAYEADLCYGFLDHLRTILRTEAGDLLAQRRRIVSSLLEEHLPLVLNTLVNEYVSPSEKKNLPLFEMETLSTVHYTIMVEWCGETLLTCDLGKS